MRRTGRAERCPTCGRVAVRPAICTVSTRVGRREVSVADVPVEECANCGERLYDLAALHRIAAARGGTRRRRAA